MGETKFTPGPWTKHARSGLTVVCPAEYVVASCGGHSNNTRNPDELLSEQVANTNLIAAAPDIYDALVKAREVIRHITYREDHLGDAAKDVAIKADAALAKALGEGSK